MKRPMILLGALTALAFVLAACGTAATPPYEADLILEEAEDQATAIIAEAEATAAAIVAQAGDVPEATEDTEVLEATPVPAEVTEQPEVTETAEIIEVTEVEVTELPEVTEVAVVPDLPEETEAPEPGAVAEATEEVEATEESDEDDAADAADDGDEELLRSFVDFADAETGEELFNQFIEEVSFACSTCHYPDQETQLVGPGLLNVYERADTRVEGQGAYSYVYTSIRDSQAHIVEGYPAGVMPVYTEDILSDEDIYHIMAYLEDSGEE